MSTTLIGRGKHKLRTGIKKVMAGAATLAVASTIALGAATPAASAIVDEPFPGQVKPGHHITGVLAYGATWFGALENPSGSDFYAWCVQVGLVNPTSNAVTKSTLPAGHAPDLGQPAAHKVNIAQMAYLLDKYESTANKDSRAALGYLIHANFEQGSNGVSAAGRVSEIVRQVRNQLPAVYSLATQYVAEARTSGVTGYESGTVQGDGERTGTINGIGIKTQGGWQAGKPIKVTLDGPAVFKSTGTKTWTGTSQPSPISLEWVATGNGPVTSEMELNNLTRTTLTKYAADGSVQDTLSYGDRNAQTDPATRTVAGPEWRVTFDFQPEITTQVESKFISKGDSFLDKVTAKASTDTEWTKLANGSNVKVKAEGTLYGPYTTPQTPSKEVPAGAPVAGKAELTFDGPGELTAGQDIKATGSGYYTWVWEIKKASQGDNAQYIRADYTDGFFTVGETTIVKMAPEVTTERDERIIKPGDKLIDHVTVSLPEGDEWITDEAGKPVEIPVTVTSYGPFDTPQAQTADVPAGAPVAGTETLVFTAEGSKSTSGDAIADKPGFYTYLAVGAETEYSEKFTHDFWVEEETASARHEITHSSIAREYNVVPGGRAFDTITIGGFPESQGTFEGLGGWIADGTLADVTVYGPLVEAPATEEVPADAPVFFETQIPAKNGVFNLGYTDEDMVSPTEGGHYVFVYSYDGDDRVAPFASAFNDVLEQFYVPTPEVPETPELPVQVVTQATKEVGVGQPFFDTALVTGNTKEGDYLIFEAFGPQTPGETPVCDEPFFTSKMIIVDGPGYYESGETTVDKPGSVYWVETLFDKDAKELHKGKCGIPSETTKITEKPWVTTKAISDSGDKPVVGDDIWDTIQIGGTFPEGAVTEVELFFTEGSITDLTCENPIWTSDKIEIEAGKFEYVTGKYTTTKVGTYSFLEKTYTKDGELISAGKCGEPSETLVVSAADEDQGEAEKDEAAQDGDLAKTGANNVTGILGAAVVLLAAGGAAIYARRRHTA